MGTDQPLGQIVAHLDEEAPLVTEFAHGLEVLELLLLDRHQLILGPDGILLGIEERQLPGLLGEVANRRGALLADEFAEVVEVGGIAPGEHGGPGETRIRHFVVEEHAVPGDPLPRADPGAEEPPLIAPEEHMGAGDRALDGGAGAVAVIRGDGEGLGRHEFAEARIGLGRVDVVVIERVGVLHALGPAAQIVGHHRILELAAAQGNPDPLVHGLGIEADLFALGVFGIRRHGEPRSGGGVPARDDI